MLERIFYKLPNRFETSCINYQLRRVDDLTHVRCLIKDSSQNELFEFIFPKSTIQVGEIRVPSMGNFKLHFSDSLKYEYNEYQFLIYSFTYKLGSIDGGYTLYTSNNFVPILLIDDDRQNIFKFKDDDIFNIEIVLDALLLDPLLIK